MTAPGAGDVDVIVLSGGAARRLGGIRKTAQDVGGAPLLSRVTSALPEVRTVVVVGDPAGARRVDVVTREDPPGGGPVAGIAAGLAHVGAGHVLVLAGDLPFVTVQSTRQLLDALDDHDVAVAVDAEDRDQWLLAAWRTVSLRAALDRLDAVDGASVRALAAHALVVRVPLAGTPPPWTDVDTPADLDAARLLVEDTS